MKKRWRWNNEAVERSDLDSILDKVVRDLFARGDRPKHRRSGAARPPAKRRRQNFALEAIEPRLLLSADISYTPAVSNLTATHFTLKAVNATDLKLYDDAATPNEVGSATLSDGSVTVERSGGSVVQAGLADTVHIDLGTFSNLNASTAGISTNGNLLSIQFTGGDQSVFQDKVSLDGSATLGFGLTVKSDSAISSSAHASFGGDFSLEVTDKSTGFLNSDKAVFAQTNAQISLDNANISANKINLSATSDLTGMKTDGFSLGPLDAKVIVALPTTGVSILDGSHLTATSGDIMVSAITKVGTAATDSADNTSDNDSTGDAVVALTTVTASTTLSVQDSQTLLSATGKVGLTASTSIDVTTTADGKPAASSSKGASVAVSIVTGGGTHASVSGGAEIDGSQIDVNSL